MTSDAIVRPDLLDHLLRAEAMKATVDCELNVRFQVWNPGTLAYEGLGRVNVDLVRSDGLRESGETDTNGKLWKTINTPGPNDPFVIKKINKLADGLDFHFEVVGDAVQSGTLKSKIWYGSTYYPIDTWSTRGWTGPGNQAGNFRPSGATFGEAVFSVGVAYRFDLKYSKRPAHMTPFPAGLTISTLVNGVEQFSQTTEFGKPVTNVIFAANPEDDIEFEMSLDIEEDSSIDQAALTVSIVTNSAQSYLSIGQLLNPPIDTLKNSKTELLMGDAALLPPQFYPAGAPEGSISEAVLEEMFSHAAPSEKLCAAANFFVRLAEQYRRLSGVLHHIAGGTQMRGGASAVVWQGLPGIQALIDFSHAGVAETGKSKNLASGRYESQIFFGPANIAGPRLTTTYHESAHALMNWYYFDDSDNTPGATHSFHSMTNPRFAYMEGFAEFVALLFMSIGDARYFDAQYNWRTVFSSGGPRPWVIVDHLGNPKEPPSEQAGFDIEGAFALALYAVWVDIVRGAVAPGESRHVIDQDDGGEITGAENAWVKTPAIKAYAGTYIWDAICQAVGASTIETTIDILQKVTEIAASNSRWGAIHPTFLTLSLKFPFDIDALDTFPVVPSNSSPGDFELAQQGRIQCTASVNKTVLMHAEYISPNTTASLVGAANSSIAVIFSAMDQSQLAITPNDVGTFDLRVDSDGHARIVKQAVQVT